MGKERSSSGSLPSASAMCTLDKHHNNLQPDIRAPLRTIPSQASPTATMTQSSASLKLPQTSNDPIPVASFEMEDTTTGSGGTSWTLRVPWLRNKRPRRVRQDDENSSIQTIQSRSTGKPVVPGSEDQDVMYYGGLMKTTSPIFVSVETGNIEALEGDGLYRDPSPASSNRVLQQQRQPQRQSKSASKQRRRQSNRKGSHKASRRGTPEMDQNFLPQHNPPPPPPPPATLTAAPTEAGTNHRHYFLASTPGLEPKNNNKVFRNRSWISTSSRESEGRRDRRGSGNPEDDSLADFDETEWTPQDSAYGAAIPVCGWVPKRLRQGIEATLIAFTVFALVYLVVTTSISISEGKADGKHVSYNDTNSGVKGYDNGLEFDDDWYVEYSQYQNDEDDYFNDDMNGGDRGNDGDHGG